VTGYSGGQAIDGGTYDIKPLGRTTIPIHSIAAFQNKDDLAIKIEADKQVMAERAIYAKHNFGRGVYVWDGSTETGVRSNELSNYWYLPEGFTTSLGADNKAFLEYLVLFNPGHAPTNVTLLFMKDNSQLVEKKVTIPADSRQAIEVNSILTGEHSVQIVASKAITAERVIYYNSFPPPQISGVNPASGYTGTKVTISGSNFIDMKKVLLDDQPIGYQLVNQNTITATISGSVGAHTMKIDTEKGTSNGVQFTINQMPVYSSGSTRRIFDAGEAAAAAALAKALAEGKAQAEAEAAAAAARAEAEAAAAAAETPENAGSEYASSDTTCAVYHGKLSHSEADLARWKSNYQLCLALTSGPIGDAACYAKCMSKIENYAGYVSYYRNKVAETCR
jgi:hypothetical protein